MVSLSQGRNSCASSITGGTGTIGRRLVGRLVERGDHPVVLSRRADKARLQPALQGVDVVQGDPAVAGGWDAVLDGCDAVVNLAGHNVFAERWNAEVKRQIRDSRIDGTENLVAALARASARPKVLVNASAIGFYGPHGDEELTETAKPGDDFMATICRDWEGAAVAAESLGVRVARVRIGVVLARGEGALGVMAPIFRMGGASPVGSGGHSLKPGTGQQWMSWVHVEDLVGILMLALDNPEAKGPINGTAPQAVRNADFARALAGALRKGFWPPFLPIGPPDALLKLILGEVADVITEGQRVIPSRAKALGYTFRFPELAGALSDLYSARSTSGRPKPDPEPAVAGVQT